MYLQSRHGEAQVGMENKPELLLARPCVMRSKSSRGFWFLIYNILYASLSLVPRKHKMAIPNTKKDESSIANAPQPITPACLRITGMAMLPTTEAPVINLVASIQL